MIFKLIVYTFLAYLLVRKSKSLRTLFFGQWKRTAAGQASQFRENRDPYEVLNCAKNCSDEELKQAYRDLAKKYHPDTIASKDVPDDFVDFATQKFQEIQKAYEVICDERKI